MSTTHVRGAGGEEGERGAMRLSIDVGGTFTDVVVENGSGQFRVYKAPTTPDEPVDGALEALRIAAEDVGLPRQELWSGASFSCTRQRGRRMPS